MKTYITHSPTETAQLAAQLAQRLKAGDILAFRGGMGMGKTAFTRGLAQGLGIDEREVSSPTFALVHEYRGGRLTLFHFDMYRISGSDDLYSTGFYDYLDYGGVLAVEWSENISEDIPPEAIVITIEAVEENPEWRKITLQGDERCENIGC
ncbi:MAG: tRNA (adenosine(37)-N6)-threonylcarbamoyltransferase complex ATPase subunit type 1 TsaE [Oscillospiraceae bacterium]|nr:tRNA (adenosine(37)-N6)-threonylcarbamoyltransferase complex ATPase subunit type 1 TsaE [Oscillospiraceae bacterium]